MNSSSEAFALVKDLAAELSSGELRLPSLPRVVIRLRNELSNPEFDAARLAQLIASEPALAGSVLTMANSALFRRSGKETMDLQVAISRIGSGKVQMLAMRFALRQLRDSDTFKRIEHLLEPEWEASLNVATACYLLASASGEANPDEALILGLLHNIGRIYLFSRAETYPQLFASPNDLNQLADQWHTNVGRAIVESWKLPEAVVEAVARQEDEDDGPPCGVMTEHLIAGLGLAALESEPADEALAALSRRRPVRGLRLGPDKLAELAAARDSTRHSLGLTY